MKETKELNKMRVGAHDCALDKKIKCRGGACSARTTEDTIKNVGAGPVSVQKGITLISLIITIIVMLILVSVTLSVVVGEDGLVAKAGEAKFKTEMAHINEVYQMYVLTRTMENVKFDVNTFNAGKKLLSYNTKPTNKTGTIYDVLENCSDLYVDDLEIIKGTLYYSTSDERKIKWAKEIGIEIMPYEIVDGVLISSNKNVGIVDEKTGALVIPSSVTSIGEGSFANLEGVKKIIIPSTVKEIQANAFNGNTTLEEVIFETEIINGVEYGVEKIGNSAFMNCSNLTTIEMPNTVKVVGQQVFYCCFSLKTIKLSNNIKEIPGWFFTDCRSLEEIHIPEGVLGVYIEAFASCNALKKVSLPKTLETLGDSVFKRCAKLETIDIASGNKNFASENGILFNANKTEMKYILNTAIKGTTFEVPNTVTKLTAGLIEIYPEIETIIISSSVTNIDVQFFQRNYKINSIEIDSNNPNYMSENGKIYNKDKSILYLHYKNEQTVDLSDENIIKIAKYAFDLCTNLETVILPDTLESLEDFAFYNLDDLKNVTLGKNINSIAPLAFYGSVYIENMTIDPENEYYTIEGNTIFNKDKTILITVLNWVTEYTIPEGVQEIGVYAFHTQRNMTKIEIPDTVTKIGRSFNNCLLLTQIEIPSSVEKINSSCFVSCSKLEKIIIHKEKGSVSGSPWGCPIGARAVEWKP